MHFVYGAITHYGPTFQTVRLYMNLVTPRAFRKRPRPLPLPPWRNAHGLGTPEVWAVPFSLAATDGITIVFFSWGYLDVSVPPVRLVWLCIHHTILKHYLQ